jgi:hypothetical protein
MAHQSWREWNIFVSDSNAAYRSVIFAKRTGSTKFIKKILLKQIKCENTFNATEARFQSHGFRANSTTEICMLYSLAPREQFDKFWSDFILDTIACMLLVVRYL